MKVAREIMSTNLWSVLEETTLPVLTRMLREKDISGVPVLDRVGRPVGVVSMYDLLNVGGREADPDGEASQYWASTSRLPKGFHELDGAKAHLTVGDIMTPAVYSVEEDTPISQVCDFFTNGQIHRVLVTRRGELAGIITATDLITELKSVLTLAPASN